MCECIAHTHSHYRSAGADVYAHTPNATHTNTSRRQRQYLQRLEHTCVITAHTRICTMGVQVLMHTCAQFAQCAQTHTPRFITRTYNNTYVCLRTPIFHGYPRTPPYMYPHMPVSHGYPRTPTCMYPHMPVSHGCTYIRVPTYAYI